MLDDEIMNEIDEENALSNILGQFQYHDYSDYSLWNTERVIELIFRAFHSNQWNVEAVHICQEVCYVEDFTEA